MLDELLQLLLDWCSHPFTLHAAPWCLHALFACEAAPGASTQRVPSPAAAPAAGRSAPAAALCDRRIAQPLSHPSGVPAVAPWPREGLGSGPPRSLSPKSSVSGSHGIQQQPAAATAVAAAATGARAGWQAAAHARAPLLLHTSPPRRKRRAAKPPARARSSNPSPAAASAPTASSMAAATQRRPATGGRRGRRCAASGRRRQLAAC